MHDRLSGASDARAVSVRGHTLAVAAVDAELQWPPFGALMAFELLKNADAAVVVRVLSNGRVLEAFGIDEPRDGRLRCDRPRTSAGSCTLSSRGTTRT